MNSPFIRVIEYKNTDELNPKGFSRIFVMIPDQIQLVKDIIKGMDDFEWNYFPEDLVTVFKPNSENKLVYNGKFDLDILRFLNICENQKIEVLVWSVPMDYENEDRYYTLETTY